MELQVMNPSVAPLPTRRFSVVEYEAMGAAGILEEDDRVELIEGHIVPMSPIGIRHSYCVDFLNVTLVRQMPDEVTIRVQGTLRLGNWSQPEPDLALLRKREGGFWKEHPDERSALLVIEVADSSLRADLRVKVPMYAAQGVPEVWVVDVLRRQVHVFTEPRAESRDYGNHQVLKEGSELVPTPVPAIRIAVADMFGED